MNDAHHYRPADPYKSRTRRRTGRPAWMVAAEQERLQRIIREREESEPPNPRRAIDHMIDPEPTHALPTIPPAHRDHVHVSFEPPAPKSRIRRLIDRLKGFFR